MRIAYDNYIDDVTSATSLTALTENTYYPITNVQNQRLTKVYKSTACTAQTVTINLGSAHAITTAAILGHNISSAATVTISANSSDSWPGATSQTITYNVGMMLAYFTSVSYQYWQFSIDDGTNTDGHIEIGRLWLGDYITVDPSSLLSFKVTKHRSDNVFHGRGRQKFASIGTGWREFAFDFPLSDETMLDKIGAMYDAVGNHSSFIFCNFDSNRNYTLVEPCYVSLKGPITFNHQHNMKYTYSLTMEEEK
jgi:hypothetical protein